MKRALLMASLVALLPAAGAAETIALTTPLYQGMSGDDAKKLTARFQDALRKAGAEVVSSFGQERGAEFVTSLVVGRHGKEVKLSVMVTRVRRDTWAAREDATANGHDLAALEAAIDELASRVAIAARNAPPRSGGAPPPPARAPRLKLRLQERQGQEEARAAKEAEVPTLTNPQAAEESSPPAEETPQP